MKITGKIIHVLPERSGTSARGEWKAQSFVKQVLTLTDASGNLVTMSIPSKNPSAVSCTLSGIEHEYRLGDIIYVASAKVSRRYESYGSKYTRLSHVKFASLNV